MDDRGVYQYFEDVNWGLLRLWGDRQGLDVLDVGCGFATTSQYIESRGNRVTGIEESADAVVKARGRIGRVVQRDLQDFDGVAADLEGARFDVVVFADVLEHLAWPLGVLRKYLAMLKQTGSVIVSLPNVGLWSVRLAVMTGRFEYEDTGVLDRTHLRFFTRASARRMLDAAGLDVFRTTYNPGLVRPFVPLAKKLLSGPPVVGAGHDPAQLLESRPYRVYLKAVYPIERSVARLWPGLLAFQMIFEARRKEAI
jgi:2-polyprenyl-3-methyl-5-hydroxy-6-metoxy-1,4-benzoquinol methylase